MNKLFEFAIYTSIGLALSLNASAATDTFNFGTKLNGAGPLSLDFASLTFNDVLHEFTLNFNDPTSSFGSKAYIDLVAVDYNLNRNIHVKNVIGDVS